MMIKASVIQVHRSHHCRYIICGKNLCMDKAGGILIDLDPRLQKLAFVL